MCWFNVLKGFQCFVSTRPVLNVSDLDQSRVSSCSLTLYAKKKTISEVSNWVRDKNQRKGTKSLWHSQPFWDNYRSWPGRMGGWLGGYSCYTGARAWYMCETNSSQATQPGVRGQPGPLKWPLRICKEWRRCWQGKVQKGSGRENWGHGEGLQARGSRKQNPVKVTKQGGKEKRKGKNRVDAEMPHKTSAQGKDCGLLSRYSRKTSFLM